MSDIALAKLTREVVSRPYEEQVMLLDSLNFSVRNYTRQKEKKDWEEVLDKYTGCMGGLWKDDDPLEYQRILREDREIG